MLKEIAKELKNSDRPVVRTLQNHGGTRVIAIGLGKNVELKKHVAPSKATLYVLQGTVHFHLPEVAHELNCYDTFEIPLETPHSVIAETDAIFMIIFTTES